jgi:hypothetical protein
MGPIVHEGNLDVDALLQLQVSLVPNLSARAVRTLRGDAETSLVSVDTTIAYVPATVKPRYHKRPSPNIPKAAYAANVSALEVRTPRQSSPA